MRNYLIVDDNRAFGENVAEILRDDGASVALAADGAEALELVKQTHFDALVTDMRMPVMSGAVLVHEVHRLDPGLPVIVVTAYTRESDLVDARNEGVLAVLPKPVPLPQLTSLLSVARRQGLVAIVEDDPERADALSAALRARGFTAVSGRGALDADRLAGVVPFAAVVDLDTADSPGAALMQPLVERFPGLTLLVLGSISSMAPAEANPLVFDKRVDTGQLLDALERLYLARAA